MSSEQWWAKSSWYDKQFCSKGKWDNTINQWSNKSKWMSSMHNDDKRAWPTKKQDCDILHKKNRSDSRDISDNSAAALTTCSPQKDTVTSNVTHNRVAKIRNKGNDETNFEEVLTDLNDLKNRRSSRLKQPLHGRQVQGEVLHTLPESNTSAQVARNLRNSDTSSIIPHDITGVEMKKLWQYMEQLQVDSFTYGAARKVKFENIGTQHAPNVKVSLPVISPQRRKFSSGPCATVDEARHVAAGLVLKDLRDVGILDDNFDPNPVLQLYEESDISWPAQIPSQMSREHLEITDLLSNKVWPESVLLIKIKIQPKLNNELDFAFICAPRVPEEHLKFALQIEQVLQIEQGEEQLFVWLEPSILTKETMEFSGGSKEAVIQFHEIYAKQTNLDEYKTICVVRMIEDTVDWYQMALDIEKNERGEEPTVPGWLMPLIKRTATLVRLQQVANLCSPILPAPNPLRMEAVLSGGVDENKNLFDALSFVGNTVLHLLFAIAFYTDRPLDDAKLLAARVENAKRNERLAHIIIKSGLLAETIPHSNWNPHSTGLSIESAARILKALIGATACEIGENFINIVKLWKWLSGDSDEELVKAAQFLPGAAPPFEGSSLIDTIPDNNIFEQVHTDFGQLETSLNHTFTNRMLLVEALTHGSFGHKKCLTPDCQRLAYVGNAVAEELVARLLFESAAFSTGATVQHGATTKPTAYAVTFANQYNDLKFLLSNEEEDASSVNVHACQSSEELFTLWSACCSHVTYATSCVILNLHKGIRHDSQQLERSITHFANIVTQASLSFEDVENKPWPHILAHDAPRALGDAFIACLGAIVMDGSNGYLQARKILLKHIRLCAYIPLPNVGFKDQMLCKPESITKAKLHELVSDGNFSLCALNLPPEPAPYIYESVPGKLTVHGYDDSSHVKNAFAFTDVCAILIDDAVVGSRSPRSAVLRARHVGLNNNAGANEHVKKLSLVQAINSSTKNQLYYCKHCDMHLNGKDQWEDHIKGKLCKANRIRALQGQEPKKNSRNKKNTTNSKTVIERETNSKEDETGSSAHRADDWCITHRNINFNYEADSSVCGTGDCSDAHQKNIANCSSQASFYGRLQQEYFTNMYSPERGPIIQHWYQHPWLSWPSNSY